MLLTRSFRSSPTARSNAEKELARIEQELKDKMLGIAANAGMTAEQLADSQTKSN